MMTEYITILKRFCELVEKRLEKTIFHLKEKTKVEKRILEKRFQKTKISPKKTKIILYPRRGHFLNINFRTHTKPHTEFAG